MIGEGFKAGVFTLIAAFAVVAVLVLIGEGFKAGTGGQSPFARVVAVLVLIGEGFKVDKYKEEYKKYVMSQSLF